MRRYHSVLLLLVFSSCNSQTTSLQPDKRVGGSCEGCEALHEYGDRLLNPIDTLPGFNENQPQLRLTGRLLQSDGKTPSANIIMYIYHTNVKGIYETKGDETG